MEKSHVSCRCSQKKPWSIGSETCGKHQPRRWWRMVRVTVHWKIDDLCAPFCWTVWRKYQRYFRSWRCYLMDGCYSSWKDDNHARTCSLDWNNLESSFISPSMSNNYIWLYFHFHLDLYVVLKLAILDGKSSQTSSLLAHFQPIPK